MSLEWPPFSGKDLPENGYSLKVIRDAFATQKIDVEFSFMPWGRALASFYRGDFDAIAPEYYDQSREKGCLFSKPFQESPLGLVVLKAQSVTWSSLRELGKYHIGTVNGYLNNVEFDDLVLQGVLSVEPVVDDITNVIKVAKRRLAMAVIDAKVLEYLLMHDPRGSELKELVKFNDQAIEVKKLYVCFQPTAKGQDFRDAFDAGLQRLTGPAAY